MPVIQSTGRLVKYQDLFVRGYCTANRHPLFFTAGQGHGVQLYFVQKVQAVQYLLGAGRVSFLVLTAHTEQQFVQHIFRK